MKCTTHETEDCQYPDCRATSNKLCQRPACVRERNRLEHELKVARAELAELTKPPIDECGAKHPTLHQHCFKPRGHDSNQSPRWHQSTFGLRWSA